MFYLRGKKIKQISKFSNAHSGPIPVPESDPWNRSVVFTLRSRTPGIDFQEVH